MNPKPGIWTTEHFAAVVSQALTLLALFGFISQNDTQTLEEAITKGIAAVFIFLANAAVVVHYIKSRLHLKAGTVGRIDNPSYDPAPAVGRIVYPSHEPSATEGERGKASKAITSGLILLAMLTLGAGPVQAQYALPFRNNHEQRLKALEQKIAQAPTPQQQAPAPQSAPQPLIIQLPAQPAAPSAPPQIVYPYPAQPPLQTYPIQGQPLQTFPIPGNPQQSFPIQGQPQQTFPIGGQPKQAFPLAPPTQPQPSNPPAPASPTPGPAPAAPGAPLQTFPIAPPARPAPSLGPVPYSTRIMPALYRP